MMTKGLETRERILDTAFRLAARDGLEGLSLSALAGKLGLSKSGLFAHFTSKEELQLEMLRVASEKFVEQVMAPAFKQPSWTTATVPSGTTSRPSSRACSSPLRAPRGSAWRKGNSGAISTSTSSPL